MGDEAQKVGESTRLYWKIGERAIKKGAWLLHTLWVCTFKRTGDWGRIKKFKLCKGLG